MTSRNPPVSLHLIDPELVDAALRPRATFTTDRLPAIRAGVVEVLGELARQSPPPSIELSEHALVAEVAGREPVDVLVVSPSAASGPYPAILHVHGGGYVIGASPSMSLQAARFAEHVGCLVVSVDYRVAPEVPFPGALEDCYTALEWMSVHAAELGIDAGRIALVGESAGAGLVAALTLLARERGGPAIRFQAMNAPMLDDRTTVHGPQNPWVGHVGWSAENNRFGWSSYLGDTEPGTDAVSPYAAAARADYLAGLPPALVQVGSLDLFLDESLLYAQRLLAAGVPTEIHVYPGAHHSFETWAPTASVSLAAREHRMSALRRAFTAPVTGGGGR